MAFFTGERNDGRDLHCQRMSTSEEEWKKKNQWIADNDELRLQSINTSVDTSASDPRLLALELVGGGFGGRTKRLAGYKQRRRRREPRIRGGPRRRRHGLNKTKLLERVAERADAPKSEARKCLEAFEEVATEVLKGGESPDHGVRQVLRPGAEGPRGCQP